MSIRCGICGVEVGDNTTSVHVCQEGVTSEEVRLAFELGEARSQIAKLNRVVEAARAECVLEDGCLRHCAFQLSDWGVCSCHDSEFLKALAALDEAK